MDDGTIKEDFNELYRLMKGMSLREKDKIIHPVCTLSRDHQQSGFIDDTARLTEELQQLKRPGLYKLQSPGLFYSVNKNLQIFRSSPW